MRRPEAFVFAGPTAHGLPPGAAAAPVRWLPPARRGDIDRLCTGAAPGVVVLCDGVFESAPAVGHGELCRALDAGWQVWGVSSLGAIRAHEMRSQGMRGWGWVYHRFARHADFSDDEMALLHLPEPPYLPLGEALVDVRYALERAAPALGLGPQARRAVLRSLRPLWFGHRTAERVLEALMHAGGASAAQADVLMAWLQQHRIKQIDLAGLLRARPWRASAAG